MPTHFPSGSHSSFPVHGYHTTARPPIPMSHKGGVNAPGGIHAPRNEALDTTLGAAKLAEGTGELSIEEV